MTLQVDFDSVREQRDKLKTVRDDLKNVFDYINSDTNALKDYWESKTSRDVFESFEDFVKYLDEIKENFNTDIKIILDIYENYLLQDSFTFINNKALGTYETADSDLNKQVEEHIAS